jgi:mannose-6-phosphate isomerase-like protein (cupin superfamily)
MNEEILITPYIIEMYCLGLLPEQEQQSVERQAALHSAVEQDILRFKESLEQHLTNQRMNLPEELKTKTLNVLHNLKIEHEGKLEEQPLINKYSDYKNWLRLVKPLLPEKLEKALFTLEVRKDDHVSQIVIWTHIDYPDEVHTEVQESFIILQGRCRCFIDGHAVELEPGGFLEIPLHKHHDVQVLESPVLAVVQRIKVA